MTLAEHWEAQSDRWIRWPAPGHDSYWRYHRDQFLRLLPSPSRQTVDVGCGEGRLTRHLKELGHRIIGIDASPSMVAAARELDPSMDIRLADAAALPLDDACADLAIAFMSLHNVDAMPLAVREIARILEPGGRLCFAIVHPLIRRDISNARPPRALRHRGGLPRSFPFSDTEERDGLTMTFSSDHRPLRPTFWRWRSRLRRRGAARPSIPENVLVSEASRRWRRLPLFLHLRARRQ